MLSGLDPYSTVFDAAGKAEHAIQFEGALAGIGARIGIRDEKLTLVLTQLNCDNGWLTLGYRVP